MTLIGETEPQPVFDPHNPGQRMSTYDPKWEDRMDAARVLLDRCNQVDPWGEQQHNYRAQLTDELCDAYLAQFQYTWQYEADLRERYAVEHLQPELTYIQIPSPPHSATPVAIRQHYKKWAEVRCDLRLYLRRQPTKEWDTDIFGRQPPHDAMRHIFADNISRGRDLPIEAKFVVEQHADITHVCAIQGPENIVSIMNHEDVVMEWVAARYLRRHRFFARLRGQRQRRVFFYYTFVPNGFSTPVQYVYGHELTWGRRGGTVQKRKIDTGVATLYLSDESYKLRPELWGEIQKIRQREERKKASGSP